MVKSKKKRNKAYSGSGAAVSKPSITRVTAVNRSKPRQWWHDNKRVAKPILIVGGIVAFIVAMIFEMVRLAAS